MQTELRALLLAGLMTLAPLAGARADLSWRPLTPAEHQVVDHYDKVLSAVLDEFRADGWKETINYEIEDPAASRRPDLPLQIDKGLERTYDATPGSGRWDQLIAPKLARMRKAGSPEAKAEIGKTIQALMHVHVAAEFNVKNSAIDPPPPGNPDLRLPGVALSYRVEHPNEFEEKGVVLLFGRWKPGLWDKQLGVEPFKFVHAAGAPVIENIEIRIGGTADRVEELLHAIDWRKVNQALTP